MGIQALTATVECVKCGTVTDCTWPVADADTREDIDEVVPVEFTCPGCGAVSHEEYPGWTFNTEAG